MNPNNPHDPQQNPEQSGHPQTGGSRVPLSDIYPANPAGAAQPASYLPVGKPENGPQAPEPYAAPKPHKGHSGWREILSTILLLAIAPLIAFGITSYAIQSYQVDGESMETTLQNNDRLIVDKSPRTIARITGHIYIPHRGDIIIFNQANLPDSSFGQSKQLIKRVIGLPGEHVVVKDGKITVYNDAHPEGFNPDTSTGYKITAPSTPGEVNIELQKNQLFVCGDNRPNSEDSRYFGPINADNIVGKLSLRLLPINKAQKF
jgi:signal peptidase I